MNDLKALLEALEEKFGRIDLDVQNDGGCSACTYDDNCISCKGNAMGN